jgi:hypothetical protein
MLANDRRFIEMRAEEIKQNKRKQIVEGDDLDNEIFGNLEEEEDYGTTSQIRQVHIVESDAAELKKLSARWLLAVLNRELATKTAFNRSYDDIMNSTLSLKYKDKKGITDYLGNMSRDERRVEQTLRSHKIGRWNVGMQKGLYQYEKGVYDKEIAQWHTVDDEIANAIQIALAQNANNMNGREEGGEDVEDLERTERVQQSQEYDQGDGWDDLNEDYTDGIYYEEDMEEY